MRRFSIAVVFIAVFLLGVGPAQADLASELAEVATQIDDLEDALSAAEGARTSFAQEVLDTARRLEAVAAELLEAEEALATTEMAISDTETLIQTLNDRMDERQGVILQLRADLERERQEALARAVDIYMSAHSDAADAFSESGNPQASVGIVYADRVQNIADRVIADFELHRLQQERQVERLKEDQAEAETQQETLRIQLAEREANAAEVEARVAEVEAQLADQRALLNRLEREVNLIEGEMADLAREEDLIRALISAEQSSGGEAPGFLLRPVPGAVSSGFGWRVHPIYGDSRLHTGWDMNGSCGQPIVAASEGRVFYTGWKGGYGNTVMIDHGGGLATLYAHQSAIGVVYDQQVTTGEVIGWVGTTGTSTACHLHWEVRVNGNPVDPSPFV
jgi:murein DD-endopeptidase MepM/ murein hydrolase activator NlpD